jgi:hypothetical protein
MATGSGDRTDPEITTAPLSDVLDVLHTGAVPLGAVDPDRPPIAVDLALGQTVQSSSHRRLESEWLSDDQSCPFTQLGRMRRLGWFPPALAPEIFH